MENERSNFEMHLAYSKNAPSPRSRKGVGDHMSRFREFCSRGSGNAASRSHSDLKGALSRRIYAPGRFSRPNSPWFFRLGFKSVLTCIRPQNALENKSEYWWCGNLLKSQATESSIRPQAPLFALHSKSLSKSIFNLRHRSW